MNKTKAIIKMTTLFTLLTTLIIFHKLDVSSRLTPKILLVLLLLIVLGFFTNAFYLKNVLLDNDTYSKIAKSITDWIGFITISVITILMILTFVVSTSKVEGLSMNPTLEDGDFLFVYHFNYKPKNNDIIIIKKEDDYLVKRLIALPGDTIELKDYNELNYTMHLNGSHDPILDGYGNVYLLEKANASIPKGLITLNEKEVFILGDNGTNNNSSSDSKQNGFYNIDDIIGKVMRK